MFKVNTKIDEDDLKFVFGIILAIISLLVIFVLIITHETEYNTVIHDEDITITEWISPDGVHYWYKEAGYHAMLAPRYDNNGNLIIDDIDE